jgi:hypothetical protein
MAKRSEQLRESIRDLEDRVAFEKANRRGWVGSADIKRSCEAEADLLRREAERQKRRGN